MMLLDYLLLPVTKLIPKIIILFEFIFFIHCFGLEKLFQSGYFKILANIHTCQGDLFILAWSWFKTHWGRVTHTCVSKLTIIGSDNGLSPDRRQAIIWTNAGFLLIGPLRTNFSEILIEIPTFSFKKMRLKVSSAKRRPFCLSMC